MSSLYEFQTYEIYMRSHLLFLFIYLLLKRAREPLYNVYIFGFHKSGSATEQYDHKLSGSIIKEKYICPTLFYITILH